MAHHREAVGERIVRTHYIRETDANKFHTFTHCGMEGVRAGIVKTGPMEFSSALSNLFSASASLSHVDCNRCLKSAKRISETCTTNPRGNHLRRPA